jgi:hypothetical protein
MALTKKMLVAMEIPSEKIDEIMEAHLASVNALREERDGLKSAADKLPVVEKELEKANAELDKFRAGDWETKYNTLKGEFDTFKTDTEAKATKAAKVAAYRKLLSDAGVSEKRIDSVIKVSNMDEIKLDKDGKIEDADKLTESVKTEWADFIVTKREEGAKTPNPSDNNGGDVKKPSRAAELVAKYRDEHYGNPEKED